MKKKDKIIEELPNYFLSAPQGKDYDSRLYLVWNKIDEILSFLNKNRNEEILIEVSRMIEKRTGK